MTTNSTLSWYHDSAGDLPGFPHLRSSETADVCVIGAGFTGSSASLTLAQKGISVICLERSSHIGEGASGLNGGQIHPIFNAKLTDHIKSAGIDDSLKLWELTKEALHYLKQRLEYFGDDCDFRHGLMQLCYNEKEKTEFSRELETLNKYLSPDFGNILNQKQIQQQIHSEKLYAGLSLNFGGQIHPLKYLKNLVINAHQHGAKIYYNSPALSIEQTSNGHKITTPKGVVYAKKILLTGNGLMSGLNNKVDRRVIPLRNYIIAINMTNVLNRPMSIPLAASDTKFVVNYFRMTPDNVFLFGGGETYYKEPKNISALVKPAMLKLFPDLQDAEITHSWGGTLGITSSRIPYVHLGVDGVNIAAGFSGVGVLLAPYIGHLLALATFDDYAAQKLEAFNKFRPAPFIGGKYMHKPFAFLGLTWFALRDKLGI